MEALLQLKGIDKAFPGVKALSGAALNVYPGRVMALVGENGAGKSTMMKVLTGIYARDAGTLLWLGKETTFTGPKSSQEAGIGIIHQELNLIPQLTIAENIFLGREFVNRFGKIDWKTMYAEADKLLAKLNLRFKSDKLVGDLSIGDQQMVEIAKLCDLWLAPKQGTDAAMALAMGHVMLREFHLDNPSQYFTDYVRRYTDMPMLVMLEERDGYYAAGRMLRAADLVDALGQENNPEWKTVAFNTNGEMVAPNGSIGFRWGEKGKWNLEQRDGKTGEETELQLSLLGSQDEIAEVGFPYFGGDGTEHFNKVELENVLLHKLPVKRLQLADGSTALVTTVYDLTLANYGLERGLNDVNCATSYDDVKAYTPAWAEQITGVSRSQIIRIAREFADNADKTHGRSMIIVGAGLNHWYHLDMNYRGLINMLIFCGCVGQSGGGWALRSPKKR